VDLPQPLGPMRADKLTLLHRNGHVIQYLQRLAGLYERLADVRDINCCRHLPPPPPVSSEKLDAAWPPGPRNTNVPWTRRSSRYIASRLRSLILQRLRQRICLSLQPTSRSCSVRPQVAQGSKCIDLAQTPPRARGCSSSGSQSRS